jgi:hypothetical protein
VVRVDEARGRVTFGELRLHLAVSSSGGTAEGNR